MRRRFTKVFLGLLLTSLFIFSLAQAEENSIYESLPDQILIYQGNLVYATDIIPHLPGKTRVLLPKSAIAESIEILDHEKIKESQLSSSSGRYLLTWERKGKSEVRLNYLLTGISWHPLYSLDILSAKQGRIRYQAVIDNKITPLEAMVTLIFGKAQRDLRSFKVPFLKEKKLKESRVYSSSLSPFYLYNLGKKDLKEERNCFAILEEDIELKKGFLWSANEKEAKVVYTLENSTREPFASGIIELYQDGLYLGMNRIEEVPIGEKVKVIVSAAGNIRVKRTADTTDTPEHELIRIAETKKPTKRIVGHGITIAPQAPIKVVRRTHKYSHRVELHIKNLAKEDFLEIDVFEKARANCLDVEFFLNPTRIDGTNFIWKIFLKPGESRTIGYTYYSGSIFTGEREKTYSFPPFSQLKPKR
ncbi:MAG: hypothetical protein KAX20_05370 [Candidatus Omnitrophica bacterium]|nr:hypothetical protein [Candidatus Omnitrophota bacterium]